MDQGPRQSDLDMARRFRQLAEGVDMVFWMTDPGKNRMVYISPGYEKIWGRSCASLYAEPRSWLDAILPEDRPRVLDALDEQKRGTYDCVYRILRPDGEVRWIRDRGFPVKDAAGALLKVTGVAQDVTKERLIDERLRESEAFLEKAQEVANMGSWSFDVEAQRVLWSKECCRILGAPHTGRWRPVSDFFDLLHADDRASVQTLTDAAVAEGSRFLSETRVLHPNGRIRWIQWLADIVRAADGRALRMVGVVQDITDAKESAAKLKEAERLLSESQKLEAVGRLAGGVAHDFNNIMTAILGLTELSLASAPEGGQLRRDLEEIRSSSRRAAQLTRQLLAFSRRQVIVPAVLDLDAAVLDVSKMLRRVIGEEVKFTMRPGAGGACVLADAGQLEQLIVNLVLNARDAMPSGGELTIETSTEELDAKAADARDGLAPGGYAVLSVVDTGTGMTDEVRARIFEPFFTTKEIGKGTGLGLSTCYGIVKQGGGAILCDSRPGAGTSFRICLPRCAPPGPASALPEPDRDARGTELVLVVEDEDAVRALTVRMLRERGFETLEARDGLEALAAVGRDSERRIRMTVSDVVMPGLGGLDLAAELAKTRPDIGVLLTSGYSDDLAGRPQGRAFLPKPFTAGELALRVRRALDAASERGGV